MLDSMEAGEATIRADERLGIPDEFGLGSLVAALACETEDELELDDRVRRALERPHLGVAAFGAPDPHRLDSPRLGN